MPPTQQGKSPAWGRGMDHKRQPFSSPIPERLIVAPAYTYKGRTGWRRAKFCQSRDSSSRSFLRFPLCLAVLVAPTLVDTHRKTKTTMGCSVGDNECFDDEKPAHDVTISKGFLDRAEFGNAAGLQASDWFGSEPLQGRTIAG